MCFALAFLSFLHVWMFEGWSYLGLGGEAMVKLGKWVIRYVTCLPSEQNFGSSMDIAFGTARTGNIELPNARYIFQNATRYFAKKQ